MTYDFATSLWGVNDRYLLFTLSILDNSGPLEDIKTIRTYIVDTETMEQVGQSYWPGDCSILATSPQTDQLALWCYKTEEEGNVREFMVLEPDANPWLTQESPDTLIDDCLIYHICAWSQDGELAAYIITEDRPDSLFYTMIENPLPVSLYDERTKYYGFPAWAPNGLFLLYGGECIDAGECPNIMSIPDQEIIWRAKSSNNWGEEHIDVSHVVWSPNSRYLALPILAETDSGTEEQVIFFDTMAQQVVLRVGGMEGVILDMIWVAD
ncbi:MAG: hypothetical protein M5U34_00955 [Chloroflexi bacterium]|nr:hypothetical protein [Chloroflexota bacterium]